MEQVAAKISRNLGFHELQKVSARKRNIALDEVLLILTMRTDLAGQKLGRIISIIFGNLPLFFVSVDSALQLAHPLTLSVRVLILVFFFAVNLGSHMASTGFQASSDDFKIIDHATYCLQSQMKDMPVKQVQPSKSAKLIMKTHQHRLKKIK